jgi:hypothetical protein
MPDVMRVNFATNVGKRSEFSCELCEATPEIRPLNNLFAKLQCGCTFHLNCVVRTWGSSALVWCPKCQQEFSPRQSKDLLVTLHDWFCNLFARSRPGAEPQQTEMTEMTERSQRSLDDDVTYRDAVKILEIV